MRARLHPGIPVRLTDLGVIALICAAGLLGPALSLATRGLVPAVVGQLLAGVVLGQTGFGVLDTDDAGLQLLYTLGFATLMFTVGMHIPLHDPRVRSSLRRGMLALGVAAPLALAAAAGAHLAGGGPTLIYAVVVVSSSAAVALPVMAENRLHGQTILTSIAWITIADVVATVALPLTINPARAGHAALGALLVAALVALVFVVARHLHRKPLVKHIRKEGKRREWAIDLRLALTVLVTLSFVAQQVGASVLIAGFGTGLVVAAIGGPKRLSREVLGLGQGFLVPLFFVLLGAQLNLRELSGGDDVLLAFLLSAAAIAVHCLTAVALRLPAAAGLLASAQIGVPAAAIALGLAAGTLTQGQASAIFCAALVSIGACSAGAAILSRAQVSASVGVASGA
ncbi:cation:proton antiporter [Solirubrobacter ginsenosidimutans]|uniref:Cation:proton antiporter n=1 Tax=Solirubrobacter ginsenosidimutans TaxID=490573 RepID=A0A9X3S0R8_9ACTN|nr:cation:proton antiporter [Solirubrobacter ginsenosidimutans]MDA0161609.1 cation:proton antiporter [Solirubrobacter ginsenosidimutans]